MAHRKNEARLAKVSRHEKAFEDAVRDAVALGRTELAKLDDLVDELARAFANAKQEPEEPSGGVAELNELSRNTLRTLRRHLDHERDSLATFNVAFFGRTGAGKSTLLSAFGRLNGEYVSPGDSDWTTDIHHVDWHGCRLFDTPGINGWGRTQSRESLEQKARRAVETADIVLLCFDSQSQQALEFAKIADWIKEYGKPAIAVLNVRNSRWRHPARVPESQRHRPAESVRQHADNIRTELAKIGLSSIPVVAVQSKRALFARASTPFHGPGCQSLVGEREAFGVDYLNRWSNFETLERLMSAAIAEGGVDIRLAALREDLRARCRTAAADFEDKAARYSKEAGVQDDAVESLLTVIGYPSDAERKSWLTSSDGADLLAAAEGERGQPFTASTLGTLDRHVSHQSASRLAGERRASRMRVDALISSAFEHGTLVDPETFQDEVFREEKIQQATSAAWAARNNFLERELELAAVSGSADTRKLLITAASIFGSTGNNTAGSALRGAGIAAGAAAVAVPFAVANFWNPAGWATGLAAAGIGIAGQVQQFFGKRIVAAAEKQRRSDRINAIADANRAVTQTFDACEESLIEDSRSKAWELVGPIVAAALRAGTECRSANRQALALADGIHSRLSEIESAADVDDILRRAQIHLAPSPLELKRTLLGEDWLEATDGLRPVVVSESVRDQFVDKQTADRQALGQAIRRSWSTPDLSTIRTWRYDLEDAAYEDVELLDIASDFRRVAERRPVFTVFGDYNSGKSSLVRRILVENGVLDESKTLDIQARPSTGEGNRYQFPRFTLVDTPGLQSGNQAHESIARNAIAESALVFVVVHVNLLIGNTSLLEDLASGSTTVAPKGSRIVFLINRSDELGVDPLAGAAAYIGLQDRKRAELITALASRSITIHDDQVYCLAADPYCIVGNATGVGADAFDGNRLWDGIGALIGAIADLPDEQFTAAATVAAFDTGVTALKVRQHDLTDKKSDCQTEIARTQSHLSTLQSALDDANVLQESIRALAKRFVDNAVATAIGEIYERDPDDPTALNDLVQNWLSDARLCNAIEQYGSTVTKDLAQWHGEHESNIRRELYADQVTPMAGPTSTFSATGSSAVENAAGGIGTVAGSAQNVAKVLGNREAVYAIGKQFGHKFKPWGAVKGGAKVAKFSTVLGVVATAADAKSMVDDGKKAKKREANQSAAADALMGLGARLLDQLTIDDDETSPLGYLQGAISELEGLIGEFQKQAQDLELQNKQFTKRLETTDDLISRALALAALAEGEM
ncbi:GTPase [Gordonia jacobaea]|uniref:GTPase n=1 Tax=Gordonia jacobaea TaxID=122202 RepID=UPI003D746587